ncbi:hypothetical protein [Aestuariivirga sp.]|uniref:hypothetical protein n=1 Tax=Aestuariivirga sp. TaxID=2650926 RepID=UPI0035B29148
MSLSEPPGKLRRSVNRAAPQSRESERQRDVVEYIAGMLASLRELALKVGHEKLVASLEAAYYQASAPGSPPPSSTTTGTGR